MMKLKYLFDNRNLAVDSATIANADKAAALKDLGLYSGQDSNDPLIGVDVK